MAICFSSCNRRFGYGVGGAGAAPPPPAPPQVSYKIAPTVNASRYAPLESQFKLIASSEDGEEVHNAMLDVLEMCESGESMVSLLKGSTESTSSYYGMSIREYLEILQKSSNYRDEISEVFYNSDGKINHIELFRELSVEEVAEAARIAEEQAVEAEMKTFAAAPPPPPPAAPPPSAAAPRPSAAAAPSMPSASRYAPVENHFKIIASSTDIEEISSSTMQVLEMCESGEIPVMLMIKLPEPELLYVGIREYMLILTEDKIYEDRIDYIEYSDEGKIIEMNIVRE